MRHQPILARPPQTLIGSGSLCAWPAASSPKMERIWVSITECCDVRLKRIRLSCSCAKLWQSVVHARIHKHVTSICTYNRSWRMRALPCSGLTWTDPSKLERGTVRIGHSWAYGSNTREKLRMHNPFCQYNYVKVGYNPGSFFSATKVEGPSSSQGLLVKKNSILQLTSVKV